MISTTKNTIKIIAFALLMNGVSHAANAADLYFDNSSNYIVTSHSTEFNSFMTSRAKRFVNKSEQSWNTFNNVVRSYEVSNGRFQQMTELEKADFYASVSNLKAKLKGMRGKEAKMWLKKVSLTESIYTFVWNSKVKEQNTEIKIELPNSSQERQFGR